jgi:hypothetical protein
MINTVWRVFFGGANFRGKSEKALRINFRGFKFRDSNPVQWRGAAQTISYIIDRRSRSRSISETLLQETWTNGMR